MSTSRTLLIHPFAFVTLPVLASPMAPASVWEAVAIPLVVVEVVMLLELLLLKLILKDWLKAAVLASLSIPFFFCFRAFYVAIDTITKPSFGKPAEDGLVLVVYLFLSWCVAASLLKGKWQFGKSKLEMDFKRLNTALNVMSIYLLVVNSFPVIMQQSKSIAVHNSMLAEFHKEDSKFPLKQPAQARPDIYYLILDCNANTNTLKEIWNYDNSDFLKYLTDKGFCVVPNSFSNYDRTALSIPSALNMQYIDVIPEKLGRDFADDTLNYRLIQDNRVSRLLRALGYKYVNVFSGFQPTEYVPTADVNYIKSPGSNFLMAFLSMTVLWGIEKYCPLILETYSETRLVPYKFIDDIASIPGPKFVLMHSLLSHPPNVFDKDGKKNPLPLAMLNEKSLEGYVEQIKYTEQEVKHLVTRLLDRPGPKPIIIIHSDHGPMFSTGSDDKAYYNENMRILLAYYLPENMSSTETLTPVNVSRMFFNKCFGANFPMLPDKAYCTRNLETKGQYDWKEVTDDLIFPDQKRRATPSEPSSAAPAAEQKNQERADIK